MIKNNGLSVEIARDICKLGRGKECCRYLVCGKMGFECAKLTPMKKSIDKLVTDGGYMSSGDNCKGRGVEAISHSARA